MVVELARLRVTRDFTAAAHTLGDIAPATASTGATWVGWVGGWAARRPKQTGAGGEGEVEDMGNVDASE